ncbi:MAG: pitrilysin family protein [Christensenellales bacterium]
MLTTLGNGIKVIAERLDNYNSAAIGIWVKTGSACETPEQNGISHFIEHMMFKGTGKRTALDIAVEMDKIGGQLNAFTAKECTCYHARVISDKLDIAIDILSDLFINPKLDAAEIEKEKGVVLEEIAMMGDNVEELAHEKISELFFTGSTLSQPILGNAGNISAFTRDDLTSYIDDHYYPANAVVSVAGRYDKARLTDMLEAKIGSFSRGSKKEAADCTEPFVPQPRIMYIEKDVEQTHLCLSFPGCTFADDERFALAVLNNVLGGGMSSRLFQSIREQKGLAYSVFSYPSSYTDSGMFSLYAGTTAANADTVLTLMANEIDIIKKDKLSETDFLQGKEQLRGNYLLSMESVNAKMSAIGKSQLLLDKVYDEKETLEKINAVTPRRVADVIDKIFDYNKMSAVFAGKIEKRDKLDKFLEGINGQAGKHIRVSGAV